MSEITEHAIATILGVLITIVEAAYMLYLRVPSALEIRPELADVGLVAGLFGVRPMVYLFHNFTTPIIVLNGIFFILMFNLFVFRK